MAVLLNIVVVEDNDLLREHTVDILRQEGHRVTGLSCAEDVDNELGNFPVDLYILDLNLPGEDGLSLARRIRQSDSRVGIIMTTSRGRLQDKLTGYESGADIYIPKPVDPDELLAAVSALVRRVVPGTGERFGGVVLDLKKLTLKGQIGETTVTDSEATILTALARAPGHRLETWQLSEMLGKDAEFLNKSSLEVRIVRLRKKLAQVHGGESNIKSIRLYGYQLGVAVTVD